MYLAHAAHTLTTIAYFLPVVAFLVWLAIVQIKDRRSRAASDEGGSTLPPSHLRSDQVD
jgi:cytochrome c oxidase assembly factor CtaG